MRLIDFFDKAESSIAEDISKTFLVVPLSVSLSFRSLNCDSATTASKLCSRE